MPNIKCCPKPTAAAVGQAPFCHKWTQAAATPTASPVQDEQELLLGIVPILPVSIPFVPMNSLAPPRAGCGVWAWRGPGAKPTCAPAAPGAR
eukprot:9058444-Pyramimonas_sp.AAC.1